MVRQLLALLSLLVFPSFFSFSWKIPLSAVFEGALLDLWYPPHPPLSLSSTAAVFIQWLACVNSHVVVVYLEMRNTSTHDFWPLSLPTRRGEEHLLRLLPFFQLLLYLMNVYCNYCNANTACTAPMSTGRVVPMVLSLTQASGLRFIKK